MPISAQKGVSAAALKYLALAGMTCDHLCSAFAPGGAAVVHPLTRFVAPLFIFLLSQSYQHTRAPLRLLGRVTAFAGLTALLRAGMALCLGADGLRFQGQMLALMTCGLCMLLCLDALAGAQRTVFAGAAWAVGALAALVGGCLLSGGLLLMPFLLLCRYCYPQRRRLFIAFTCVLGLVGALQIVWPADHAAWLYLLGSNCDFLLPTVLPFIGLYNGKAGRRSRAEKWFFYLYYPLHLAAIELLIFWMA